MTETFWCEHPITPENTLMDAGKARCRTCRNKTFREAKQRARKREKAILEVFPEVVEALGLTKAMLTQHRGAMTILGDAYKVVGAAYAKARAATANG